MPSPAVWELIRLIADTILAAGTLIPNENFPHGKISRSLKAAYNLIADPASGFSREKVRAGAAPLQLGLAPLVLTAEVPMLWPCAACLRCAYLCTPHAPHNPAHGLAIVCGSAAGAPPPTTKGIRK